jgi:hypothetical protein
LSGGVDSKKFANPQKINTTRATIELNQIDTPSLTTITKRER